MKENGIPQIQVSQQHLSVPTPQQSLKWVERNRKKRIQESNEQDGGQANYQFNIVNPSENNLHFEKRIRRNSHIDLGDMLNMPTLESNQKDLKQKTPQKATMETLQNLTLGTQAGNLLGTQDDKNSSFLDIFQSEENLPGSKSKKKVNFLSHPESTSEKKAKEVRKLGQFIHELDERDLKRQATSNNIQDEPVYNPIYLKILIDGDIDEENDEDDSSSDFFTTLKDQLKGNLGQYAFYVFLFISKYLLLPIMGLFANLSSLVDLVLTHMERRDQFTGYRDHLQILEFLIGIIWCFTFSWNVLVSDDTFFRKLFNFERLRDFINIYHILAVAAGAEFSFLLIFFCIFRAQVIYKLRNDFKLAYFNILKYVFGFGNDQGILIEDPIKDDDELFQFIINSLIDLTAAIFLEATVILTLDQLLDRKGFYNALKEPLNYQGASYFVVICFSTVGYGDIYALIYQSRLLMIVKFKKLIQHLNQFTFLLKVLIITNLTVLSNFLSEFTQLLFSKSSYDRQYDYSDHLVILGQFPDYFLSDFLSQLVEIDRGRQLINPEAQNQENIKVVIVNPDDPNHQVRGILNFYDTSFQYDNEIAYLKDNPFTSKRGWMWKSSLKHCRGILAISLTPGAKIQIQEEWDQKVIYIVHRALEAYPKLEVSMIIQTKFGMNIKKNFYFRSVNIISSREMNEYILGNSVENAGFNTMIVNALTMKVKLTPEIQDSNSLLSLYIDEMDQEIYSYEFPDFFVGRTFQESCQILYFYSLKPNENFQKKRQDDKQIEDRGLLLIGVETKNLIQRRKPKRRMEDPDQMYDFEQVLETEFLINPANYIIRKGDLGYVITEDFDDVIAAKDLSSAESTGYTQYKEANRFLQLLIEDQEKCLKQINFMYEGVKKKYEDFKISVNRIEMRVESKILQKLDPKLNLNDYLMFKSTFDLYEGESPKGCFKKHVIVVGQISSFKSIVHVLRQYSERPLLLFTEEEFNSNQWKGIYLKYTNAYFVRGFYMKLAHLDAIDVQKAYQILILADGEGTLFSDSAGICLARILIDHYQIQQYLIELREESSIKYISQDPGKEDTIIQIGDKRKQEKISYFFWGSFVQGNVFFSSSFASSIARTMYNQKWMYFIRKLTIPNSKDMFQGRKKQKNIEDSDDKEENNILHTLIVDAETAAFFRFYGVLQFALMSLSPPIIALGMIQNQLSTQLSTKTAADKMGFKFDDYQHLFREKDMQSTMLKIGSFQATLTNPSFFMPLSNDDSLIVIGSFKINQSFQLNSWELENENIFSQKPFSHRIKQKAKVLQLIKNFQKASQTDSTQDPMQSDPQLFLFKSQNKK